MSRTICFALSMCLLGSNVFAQGGAMLEVYGEGVHRYFAGDYTGADQLLSRVVDSGSLDPRAHYFRGLCRDMQVGGGSIDYENGARLEAEGKRAYDVGAALIRIQGGMRAKIEVARRDARLMAAQQRMMLEQARANSGEVIPSESTPPAPSETAESDPFSGEGLRSDEMEVAPATPATPEVDAASDPFGDDPAAGAAQPSTTPPAADPFGSPTPDAPADPFGGAPATDPGADPFGGAPATDPGADPFGGAPAAGGGADPFGGDPFGGTGM